MIYAGMVILPQFIEWNLPFTDRTDRIYRNFEIFNGGLVIQILR